jgi:hypothetical protein
LIFHHWSFTMKRFLTLIFVSLATLLSACTTTGPQPNLVQVQQVVTSFCPTVNTDLSVLSTSPTVAPALQAQFKQMLVVNQGICSLGSGLKATDLQTLNTQVVQAAITVLLANPAIPNQPAILLALQLGQPLVTQAIAQLQAAAAPGAPVPAAMVVPASAPAPAAQ